MTELFNRQYELRIADLKITGLRVAFRIVKSLTEPNTLDLAVYNLSEETRTKIQKPRTRVEFSAGYAGAPLETLFVGDTTLLNTVKQGPDFVTHVQAGDGIRAIRTATVSESFASGTPVAEVIRQMAQSAGVGLGNLASALTKGNRISTLEQYAKGLSVSGMAHEQLKKVAASYGLNLSVQDNQLQFVADDEAVGGTIADLKVSTGLIDSPEIGEDKDKRAIVKAKVLIQQRLTPGHAVRLTSRVIQTSLFRVEKVSYNGDNRGPAWHADLELRAL
jgi:phage protein D